MARELLGHLAGYLYLADQSYEGATEAQLSQRLQRKGVRMHASSWVFYGCKCI